MVVMPLNARDVSSNQSPPAGQIVDGAGDTPSIRRVMLSFLGVRGRVRACVVDRVSAAFSVVATPSGTALTLTWGTKNEIG